jgi:hypothetical protein
LWLTIELEVIDVGKDKPAGKMIDRQKGHQTRRARGGKKQKRR